MVGVCLASPSGVPLDVLLFCTLGVGLVASSAAVINHLADSHIDAKMARTQNRPVATGRVGQREGLIFAAILGVAGMLVLWFLTNPLTAWLNLCSWVGYGLIYTFFLKRATSQNIVIGGLFGAAPPLFGWTAVTNVCVCVCARARRRKTASRAFIYFYTVLLSAISLMPFLIGSRTDLPGGFFFIGVSWRLLCSSQVKQVCPVLLFVTRSFTLVCYFCFWWWIIITLLVDD